MRMKSNYRRKILTCHMCSVHEGFGRTIKVIGIYSICNWCFENIIPKFSEAFNPSEDTEIRKKVW
jgi:hypothetical protein